MKKQSWSRILTALFVAFATTASAVPIGVTVNSVHLNDDASITDPNWTYNSQTGILTFHGSGNFMVSGTNTAGKARIIIPNGVTNTVRFWNLNLQTPGDDTCIFALGSNASVSLILKGTNTLASGLNRAGIEVPASASLSITRSSADSADALTVTGGQYGAGIGGGNGIDGGTVIINSSMVTATSGSNGAGVGGGNGGNGGAVTISAGTLFAQGKNGGADIGQGRNGTVSGVNTFTGGAIHLANNSISVAPTDGTKRIWCMTVTNLTPLAAIVVTGLAPYGMNDLFADNSGKLHLWLPNGGYTFTAGGGNYAATITDANTTAALSALTPPPAGAYLTFSSARAFTVTPQQESWNGTLYTSTDTTFWSIFTASGATAATNGTGEYKLYLCGVGNTYITGSSTTSPWLIAADNPVACSGNIETLLDHATVADGEHPTMASCCFAYLFRDCAALASTPSLPATNLAESCYGYMFYNCSGLTQAPTLPATTLAERCYEYMFRGCTKLTQAPALPATNLADYCYANMFNRCTGLTRAPALPATTLSERCYNGMFTSCTGLTNTPALPATTLAPYCYYYMFQSCTGLTRLPDLPATNLTDSCYRYMFYKCTGIELNAEGPGMAWKIPADAVAATDWNLSMFADTSGTFKGAPVIGTTYYLASGAPDAPTFATDGTALVFGDGTVAIKIDNAESGVWYTLYAVDDLSDPDWTNVGSIRATGSTVVFTIPRDPTVPRRFFKVVASATTP